MRNAFTLIELLVVVTIISVLMAFLFPLMGNMREQSRRVVCASNQRQWFTGISGYAQDHRGQVPRCTRNAFGGATPHLMWLSDDQTLNQWAAPTMAGEWNIATMMGYLEDGSRQVAINRVATGGVLNCPSAKWNREATTLHWPNSLPNYIHSSYAYWPGVGLSYPGIIPNIYIPYQGDFCGTRLEANKLVISDSTATWSGYTLGINHTIHNARSQEQTADLAGMNCLYGDGRVAWKTRQFLRPDLMTISATSDGAGTPLRCIRNNAPDVIYY